MIIGGDFQMDKLELEATSFHTMIGGIIIPMNGGHPTVNSCERAIDHIVATRGGLRNYAVMQRCWPNTLLLRTGLCESRRVWARPTW